MSSEEISDARLSTKPDDELAFSRIKDEIEAKAKSTADDILKQAKKEASEILKVANDKALQAKNAVLLASQRDANNLKIQEISRKKLALKMDYLEVREQVFDEILVEAKVKIQNFTSTDEYKKYLSDLLEISANSIGGGKLSLQLRKEDKSIFSKDQLSSIAKKVSEFSGQNTEIILDQKDLKTLGGLKLVREDSKLFVDNTFEKRLERASDEIRIELSELISE